MFYAHSTDNADRSDWHRLADHLRAVAALAGDRAQVFGASRAAALAGLLHDLGKYSDAFQRRLGGAIEKVDHSTAGAREVMGLAASPKDKLIAELIAYAIAGHHAGLADKIGDSGSLADRLDPKICAIEPLYPAWKSELPISATDLFPGDFDWEKDKQAKATLAFEFAFLGRMIFSCLVDADFRDTEAFYASVNAANIDREWPALQDALDHLRTRFDAYMEAIRKGAPNTELSRVRSEILLHLRSKAVLHPGVFTLNVPTGGGKTLASLAFALDHAKVHGLRRIITAIPFTSIIDQTASIFRDALGAEFVLEHHSAIDEERVHAREARDKLRLAMEDWAAPVVVTTNVQLFESLFSNRPSRCRKLHNIANAVIVLDEVQTIPLHVLRPAVAALQELVRNYRCTVVLCTATQPALSAPDFNGGFEVTAERELAPDPDNLHRKLRRTVLRRCDQPMTDDEIVAALKLNERALVIVNSRKHALDLYRATRDAGLDGITHLSTRQTAADRRDILARVKEQLRQRSPCRLIATSLVEAGVDIDFPLVWRAEAGLDQITQAAGRCNREGRQSPEQSVVTIFRPAEAKPPAEIRAFADDFARIAHKHDDLLSPAAIRDYFGEVYWRKGDGLDRHSVLRCFQISAGETNFAYRTVAENFRLIESGMQPVIIANRDEPKRILEALRHRKLTPGAAARELQPYLVEVPPRARSLLSPTHVTLVEGFGEQFAVLTTDQLYTPEIGLLWEMPEYLSVESLVV